MSSSKVVLGDLLHLQDAITAQKRLECETLFHKYQTVVQTSCKNRRGNLAAAIPEDGISRQLMRTDIQKDLVPKKATADGNCLYNSTSILLTGNEALSPVLRLLVAAELFLESDFYAHHPYFKENVAKTHYSENTVFALALSRDYDDVRNRRNIVAEEAIITCRPGNINSNCNKNDFNIIKTEEFGKGQ